MNTIAKISHFNSPKVNTLRSNLGKTKSRTETKNEFLTIQKVNVLRSCSVCGEDEWCGSDGCPLDPQ
jgi:hypothetical protein